MDVKLLRYEKLLIAARYWLLGMAETNTAYFKVLEAMEYGCGHHDGLRNGGQPEYIHQLSIFHNVRTLHKRLRNPVIVYILIFLHDAVEDPNKKTGKMVSLEEVQQIWGSVIADKLKKLSKEILGQKNPDYNLDVIFADEDCAVVKGGDRCDNVSTMYGVFKRARLERYIKETVDEFLDRIKCARRIFPDQESIFENFKLTIINQLVLINHILNKDNDEEVEVPEKIEVCA